MDFGGKTLISKYQIQSDTNFPNNGAKIDDNIMLGSDGTAK